MGEKEATLSVVLVSGGMDSCVAAAGALAEGPAAFLHLDYGQRTAARERQAFNDLADHFQLPPDRRLLVTSDVLSAVGGSRLTDEEPERGGVNGELPLSYVPFRNAHLLAAGVSWAEVLGASRVVIGAVGTDRPGYPDCREEFIRAFDRAVAAGTGADAAIAVVAPLVRLTKAEIVARGRKLEAPFHLTWSCYDDEFAACGACSSCRLRREAFRAAGMEDPIPYRA